VTRTSDVLRPKIEPKRTRTPAVPFPALLLVVKSVRKSTPSPSTHAPRTHAAVRGRCGHSANSAKTARYSTVRAAPSHATPWSSAQTMLNTLQAVNAASARTAPRTAAGASRKRPGMLVAVTASSPAITSAPGAHVVRAWPPCSCAHATKIATLRSIGTVTGARRTLRSRRFTVRWSAAGAAGDSRTDTVLSP
jgi:hypothetical protein